MQSFKKLAYLLQKTQAIEKKILQALLIYTYLCYTTKLIYLDNYTKFLITQTNYKYVRIFVHYVIFMSTRDLLLTIE